jgi:microcystin degradation protein MlrC
VVVNDIADSVTGASTGDSTRVLKAIMDRAGDLRIMGVIRDPESVACARAAGEGAHVVLDIGGSLAPAYSDPMRISGRVKRVKLDAVVRSRTCSGVEFHVERRCTFGRPPGGGEEPFPHMTLGCPWWI